MKNDLRIVNLSTYTSPTVKEVRNQEFVSYGDDNNYFQYLIDRYNGSPTNNAIINGISEMIYGKGLDATDSNKKPDQYAHLHLLPANRNRPSRSPNEDHVRQSGKTLAPFQIDHELRRSEEPVRD